VVADVELLAYTLYNYSVSAANSVGSVTSEWTSAVTMEAKPRRLAAPVCHTDSQRLDTISLTWSPPREPNGLLSWCVSCMRRNASNPFNGF